MSRLLELENVTAGYKHRPDVVKDVNTVLNSGEMVCLLGANGAGKSTLLRTISGLQPPVSGRIIIDGHNLSGLKPDKIAKLVSLVYTERGGAGGLSVRELVALGRHPHTGFFGRLDRSDRDIIDASIEKMGISALRDRKIATLSDGERQKAMIARALAQDTPIILLDEPTAFLDVASRLDTVNMLRRATLDSGKAVVMSTHDAGDVLGLCDRAWLINDTGCFIAGTIRQLSDNGQLNLLFANRGIGFDSAVGNFVLKSDKKFVTLHPENGFVRQ